MGNASWSHILVIVNQINLFHIHILTKVWRCHEIRFREHVNIAGQPEDFKFSCCVFPHLQQARRHPNKGNRSYPSLVLVLQ